MENEVKIEALFGKCDNFDRRLDVIESQLKDVSETQLALVRLTEGIDKIATQMSDMKDDVKEVRLSQRDLSDKVIILENRPAMESKRTMDDIKGKLLWLVIAALIGLAANQLNISL